MRSYQAIDPARQRGIGGQPMAGPSRSGVAGAKARVPLHHATVILHNRENEVKPIEEDLRPCRRFSRGLEASDSSPRGS